MSSTTHNWGGISFDWQIDWEVCALGFLCESGTINRRRMIEDGDNDTDTTIVKNTGSINILQSIYVAATDRLVQKCSSFPLEYLLYFELV